MITLELLPQARQGLREIPSSRTAKRPRRTACLFCLAAVALLLLAAGCRKHSPTSTEIHAITHELLAAAESAAGRQAEIAVRPEESPAAAGRQAAVADHLFITLPATQRLDRLEQALDGVAQRHHLTRGAILSAPGVLRFDYLWGGERTHSIHIVTPQANRSSAAPPSGTPRLAIIIDDLGYDPAAADALFALPLPLTVSVLPDLPHSAEIAEEAERRGYQVLLHLPMQSSGTQEKAESVELRPGMSRDDVSRTLASMLKSVPGAVGVNNHQGSLATADPTLMAELMPLLRERSLFFIDSRTTPQTVAFDFAENAGVPAASRNVFLDDVESPPAIRQQLARAERLAHRNGWSIAIGHPHPQTVATLKEDLPRLDSRGIHLVFASELAR